MGGAEACNPRGDKGSQGGVRHLSPGTTTGQEGETLTAPDHKRGAGTPFFGGTSWKASVGHCLTKEVFAFKASFLDTAPAEGAEHSLFSLFSGKPDQSDVQPGLAA